MVRVPPGAFILLYDDMSKEPLSTKRIKARSKRSFSESFPLLDNIDFLKEIFSYIGNGLSVVDQHGRFLFVNDAFVNNIGYSRSYILKTNATKFLKDKISIDEWKSVYFDDLKKRRGPVSYQLDRISKGGGARTMDVTAVYVPYDGTGYVISTERDVTGQIQLQRALYDSRNLFRFLTEGARDGIAALDTKGRFLYVNPSLEEMIGFKKEGFRGKSFFDYIQDQDIKKVKKIFADLKRGAQYMNEVIDVKASSGEIIPFEVNLTPLIKSGEVVSVHLIARDLRVRQKMDLITRQSEKMEAIRYFVSGIAQEMKNPLMGVAKRTDGLLDKYAQRDFEYISYREFQEIMRNIEKIRDQVHYCYETSKHLMAFGQKKAGLHHGYCDPNQMIQEVMKEKEVLMHQHEIQAQLLLTAKNIFVKMSAIDLIQVIHNLFDNAIQAMPFGGILKVRTSLDARRRLFVIELKDQGVGIPAEQLMHIFDPFFTTKSRGVKKNSGLGLPIAYALVKDCQGDLQIVSSLRRGTSVKVTLPVHYIKKKSHEGS